MERVKEKYDTVAPLYRVKEENTKEVGDRLIYYTCTTKILRRFTTVRLGRFLLGVFPDFPPARNSTTTFST